MKKAGTPFSGIRRLTAGCENAPQAGFTAGLRSVCFFMYSPGQGAGTPPPAISRQVPAVPFSRPPSPSGSALPLPRNGFETILFDYLFSTSGSKAESFLVQYLLVSVTLFYFRKQRGQRTHFISCIRILPFCN